MIWPDQPELLKPRLSKQTMNERASLCQMPRQPEGQAVLEEDVAQHGPSILKPLMPSREEGASALQTAVSRSMLKGKQGTYEKLEAFQLLKHKRILSPLRYPT
ncbi:hypothetical protein P7K49_001891 [Saguinus oedipus]|uniref:Uncharacterized protein n=1 Tax=Saguinus oedipus TaxID=9490 RepID=A0ABQ9WG96_SAGOE|nr:hypothetical protein P7K49_001891 [Saguinus oedipus]